VVSGMIRPLFILEIGILETGILEIVLEIV
jgi:hypothetical protein